MSTRRSFLQSAVFLPSLLSAHSFAQDAQNSPQTFADFENGWGDWTTEGLAFGDRPATGALFPGKISGFGGRGFVCTLHPRKGNAAVGKAISREFVIEKPFITFKIGGGNFPGQACLNLVVDNKIERTATGDGTANLSEKLWDVSALVGKKARLEIIDNTVSDQRGYILVDDIAFATAGGSPDQLLPESEPIIEVPLHIIQILDSQGNVGFYRNNFDDIKKPLILSDMEDLLAATNVFYRPARILFTLAANDFETRRDDYLNFDFDAPSTNSENGNGSAKPSELGMQARLKALQKLSDTRKDVVTVIVHRGSEWGWNEQEQKWSFNHGFSHGGSGIKSGLGYYLRLSSIKPHIFAHELAHAFGLPHTSKDGVNNPSALTTAEAISAECQSYLDKGGNPNHPEYAIDGDYQAGVNDTPPDPGLGFWRNSKLLQTTVTVSLRDRLPFPLRLSRNNIMASQSNNGGFTEGQIAVMRRKAEQWKMQAAKR